MSLAKNLLRKE